MDNRAKIIIGAENQAGAGINHAKKDLRELGTAAEKTGSRTKKSFHQATVSSNSFSGSIQHLTTMFVGLTSVYLGFRALILLKDITLAAARYETLGVAVGVIGNNAGYASQQMAKFQQGLEQAGISMSGARQALTRMAQAHLDLSKSAQLARVAQDTAVIGAMNSTEAFNQLVYGIQSANVRILRTIGINVSFKDSYEKIAKQLGRTATSFSQSEKAGIRLNAVLSAGKRIAGTYEGAMQTAGKQLLSLERHFDNLKVMAGAAFTPALLESVQSITGGVKDLNKELSGEKMDAIHEWGVNFRITLIEIEIEISKVAMLLDKIGGSMTAAMVNLYAFGNAIGNENSQRKYTEFMKKNIEYEKRYWQTVLDILALEEKRLALAHSLTEEGKAESKAKLDALEKTRLAIIAEEKAREAANKALEDANAGLKEYYKTLDKVQKIMDPISLAAMPEYERGIEGIMRKYDQWNDAIKENAEQAGYSTDEIALLYANLGLRMDEEINDYIKSHETGTDTIYDAWSHMYERLQDVTADWIYDMKVDFDSIVDLFKRSVAEMISAWIWGQQNMQFATSGQGGFSLGGMFGGMFGGGGAGGGGQTAAQAAMAAGYGPVAEEWALANGFTNTLQGAQSAYSLYGAYGAYQGAGGGWAGAKAGAGSFFGGGSASSLTYASWIAAAVIVAAQVLGKYNADHGYGRIEGTPQGYNVSQTMHPFAGGDWASSSWLTDPAANWLRGISGDKSPSGSDWFAYHLKEGNWEDAFFASFESALEWSNIGLAQTQRKLMEILGIPGPGEILGYSNKKRSYLTRDYDYTYDLAEGWSDPSMTHIRSKRGGEDAFGEAADWMSEGVSSILNSIEELTTGFLGAVDEKWVNQFKTSMMSLGELGFKFNISAEDEDEFEDDMAKSFSAALDGVINPVMSIAADFMRQATEEAFTSPEIEKVFGILSDDIAEFLRDDMAKVLSIFDAPLPTTVDEFEAYISSLSVGMDEIVALLSYFQAITDITDEISAAFARTSLTQSLIDINTRFIELGQLLESLGIDLTKYTDFTKAWGIALAEATYGFSADGMVAELKKIMDAPNAMAAAEQFTLDFMQQVRDGMVNSITSAFTEMMYAQMLAPLAETFLEGAETPEELMAGIHNYISAVRDIMQDPAMITGLQSIGAAMWEINQMIPSAEQLATYEDLGAVAGDLIVDGAAQAADLFGTSVRSAAQTIDSGGMSAGYHLISGGQTAASYIANAARALASIGTTAVPMAAGAIVTRPTYSLIGEAGYDEVVLPLDNRHKLVAKMEKGSQQKTTITIPLTVMTEDGRILKREIIKETFAEMKERSGRREIIIHAAGVA